MKKKPLFLKGVCKDYLWGGNRLRTEFGKDGSGETLAESWELSCHPDGDAQICGMSLTLGQYLEVYGARQVLGRNCPHAEWLPLIKLIDAKEPLSVQVHPDDVYAQKHGFPNGKTEMWYVLDAEPGASLVYGVSQELTPEAFAQAIAAGTLSEVMHTVPVHPGDVFFIPSGTLHAIGGGILIAEVQQNSNLTYRVYDYDRVGADGQKRPLHVQDALAVTRLTPMPKTLRESCFSAQACAFGEKRILSACAHFVTTLYTLHDTETPLQLGEVSDSFHHLLVLAGSGTLETGDGSSYPLRKGSSVLLPATIGNCRITGRLQLLETHCPDTEEIELLYHQEV